MKREELLGWLREKDPKRLEHLFREADFVRRQHVGDGVHLRGLIEISNHCVRKCAYCGLRICNEGLVRYRMTESEIMGCVYTAWRLGCGTVVLQSGEDPAFTARWIAALVERIKSETPLAVTLSLGERTHADLALWRRAGADRYFLRFETSDRNLYRRIHPPHPDVPGDRIAILRDLKALGYETGSGIMIGIPGQTFDSLADDIELIRDLPIDMVGAGPYLPHPDTPLARSAPCFLAADGEQVPNTETMACKVIALIRLTCPDANIPSTTALATLNPDAGYMSGLSVGANIVMPNLTPPAYRALYAIYPRKTSMHVWAEQAVATVREQIGALGRVVGTGRGDSPRYRPQAA